MPSKDICTCTGAGVGAWVSVGMDSIECELDVATCMNATAVKLKKRNQDILDTPA